MTKTWQRSTPSLNPINDHTALTLKAAAVGVSSKSAGGSWTAPSLKGCRRPRPSMWRHSSLASSPADTPSAWGRILSMRVRPAGRQRGRGLRLRYGSMSTQRKGVYGLITSSQNLLASTATACRAAPKNCNLASRLSSNKGYDWSAI